MSWIVLRRVPRLTLSSIVSRVFTRAEGALPTASAICWTATSSARPCRNTNSANARWSSAVALWSASLTPSLSICLRERLDAKVDYPSLASCAFTSSEMTFPSALPCTLGIRAFITAPMSLALLAPEAWMAAATSARSSSADSCLGR